MSDAVNLEAIIRPISQSSPAGEYLYADAIYQGLESARSPATTSSGSPLEPNWKKVLSVGLAALQSRTKDIQIAAYVAEALTWLHGLDGLRQGFQLFEALQDAFWTSVFPRFESERDLSNRLPPYEYMDEMLPRVLYVAIPLTKAPMTANYNLQQFLAIKHNAEERELRNDAIRRTELTFHQRLSADLAGCREAFQSWQASIAVHMVRKPSLDALAAVLERFESSLGVIESVRPFAVSLAKVESEEDAPATAGGKQSAQLPELDAESTQAMQSGRDHPLETTPGTDLPLARLGNDGAARRDIAAAAAALAATGRLEAAIELIDGARLSARCRRDRFIRQLELVELCLARGLAHVARPLLDELASEQETRRLEEWEDPTLCSRVLIASIACLRASPVASDGERVPGILERLYRLDPRQALRRELKP
jgi:type VI secretion system protein ImpA